MCYERRRAASGASDPLLRNSSGPDFYVGSAADGAGNASRLPLPRAFSAPDGARCPGAEEGSLCS